jgi:hypothetical protein
MPKRSTRITLSNNTPYILSLIDVHLATDDPCHGSWTDGGWRPPSQILPKTHGAWQTESSGIATGTEGWVKYLIGNTDSDLTADPTGKTPCRQELVYVHWDNPFVWSSGTVPIDFTVSTSDIPPPCNSDKGVWGFPPGGLSSSMCRHELFGAGASGAGLQGVTWWDALVNWPVLLAFTVLGDADVNLEFTVGLRLLGSVDETIFSFYDGSKGLRTVAAAAKVSRLRTLFRM